MYHVEELIQYFIVLLFKIRGNRFIYKKTKDSMNKYLLYFIIEKSKLF